MGKVPKLNSKFDWYVSRTLKSWIKISQHARETNRQAHWFAYITEFYLKWGLEAWIMHTLTVHTIQPLNDTTDTFMYDEEEITKTLWKCVQNSGSAYVESITDKKWFYYLTKERGFENRLF